MSVGGDEACVPLSKAKIAIQDRIIIKWASCFSVGFFILVMLIFEKYYSIPEIVCCYI
jgi:uncharacterized membrane protein YvbJ